MVLHLHPLILTMHPDCQNPFTQARPKIVSALFSVTPSRSGNEERSLGRRPMQIVQRFHLAEKLHTIKTGGADDGKDDAKQLHLGSRRWTRRCPLPGKDLFGGRRNGRNAKTSHSNGLQIQAEVKNGLHLA